MEEKKVIKTIRFKEIELKKITLFLEENPGMDFSTLIRIAINNFIENPSLKNISSPKLVSKNKEGRTWN